MVRKLLVLLTMILASAGLSAVVAPPASAAIDHPFQYKIYNGVTLKGTVYVDPSNGKASAYLRWDPTATNAPDAFFTIVTTLYRDGVPTTKTCDQIFIPANSYGSSPECNAYAGNPAGVNRWQASIKVLVGVSPNQTTKGPFVSDVVYDT